MNEKKVATEKNIEDIMRDIRAEILTKQVTVGDGNEPIVPTDGEHLPYEFYEHMYHAALAYDNTSIEMHVTKVNIPIIGGIIEALRGKVHALVLYYVKQNVSKQKEVNYHLLRALSIASKTIEEDNKPA
ncbi:MAG: hypothetical protein DWQ04_16975 [Chloroflexi bacterium]|nr:MAG: hypothetical protein DWQ04_16975 [Chloroflexota bacterium]